MSRPSICVPFAISIALLLFLPSAAMLISPREMDRTVVDIHLQNVLDAALPDDGIEMLVQFRDRVRDEDVSYLEAKGFEVHREDGVLPLVFAAGPARAVIDVSHDPRIEWMEHNAPLEYYMDQSVQVIGANDTWERMIRTDEDTFLDGIQGRGVTIVIVDSGIDAGHPDLLMHEKVIKNLKRDTQFGRWTELENSDTSSGHGTHCAGTVAGSGRSSGGIYRGVAPQADLIGLSMGEGPYTIDEYHSLQWVYEHSRPGSNPDNIRAISDSWGPGASDEALDPEDANVRLLQKLLLDNNVVPVFAAGNSGGDGSDVQTSVYGNIPGVIEVAAFEHDGTAVASFSSRGDSSMNETWPDIGAPGVKIMSTAARATMIGLLTATGDTNPYYYAISGTSMATPHVAGAVALLWEAAPSMRLSDVPDDYSGGDDGYWTSKDAFVHEAELILELTADYVTAEGITPSTGVIGRDQDWEQGYGLINVTGAVALALTLEDMRRDDPEATIWDAYKLFKGTMTTMDITRSAQLEHMWIGSWSQFSQGVFGAVFDVPQDHPVYIPGAATSMEITIEYSPINVQDLTIGVLTVIADTDGNGAFDWEGDSGLTTSGVKTDVVDLSGAEDEVWTFSVRGRGAAFPLSDPEWAEANIHYSVSILFFFDAVENIVTYGNDTHHMGMLHFGPDMEGTVTMTVNVYDLVDLKVPDSQFDTVSPPGFQIWLIYVLLIVIVLGTLMRYHRKIRRELKRYMKR